MLATLIAAVAGDRVAIVDSATATASALAELLVVNGLEAPGSGGADGSAAQDEAAGTGPAVHRQLTTGDVERFASLAGRLFGPDMPAVEAVELEVHA